MWCGGVYKPGKHIFLSPLLCTGFLKVIRYWYWHCYHWCLWTKQKMKEKNYYYDYFSEIERERAHFNESRELNTRRKKERNGWMDGWLLYIVFKQRVHFRCNRDDGNDEQLCCLLCLSGCLLFFGGCLNMWVLGSLFGASYKCMHEKITFSLCLPSINFVRN